MKIKKVILYPVIMLFSINLSAQMPDSTKREVLEQSLVKAVRATKNTPFAFENISKKELQSNGMSLPVLLGQQNALVSVSEDGLGVGNVSFRIRGVDVTRIHVNLNGMPLNNPESQEVYWVNLPNLSGNLQNAQIQRGVGTSANGSAAMGASVSLKTITANNTAFAESNTAIGSYNTFLSSITVGSGILKNGLAFQASYSKILSDGYIRNGKVNHSNAFATLSYYAKQQLLQINYLYGSQHTGITWLGAGANDLAKDKTYNPAGAYSDQFGNRHYYDNETDNYVSNILQALYTLQLDEHWTLHINGSLNKGAGYYENYKVKQKYKKIGLENQTVNGTIYDRSDWVEQKLLDNVNWVAGGNITYSKQRLLLTFGSNYNHFNGNHYGKLKWIQVQNNIEPNYEWYRNDALKQEINSFVKSTYQVNQQFSIFADLQNRWINYSLNGIDSDRAEITSVYNYLFWNPKIGVNLNLNKVSQMYTFLALGQREPLRTDLKNSAKNGAVKQIQSEQMFDFEIGYRFHHEQISFDANLYWMQYKNQLVQTGKLNEVGYKIMENIPHSFRTGIELGAKWKINKRLLLEANLNLSKNKLKNYTAYYDLYDTNYQYIGQKTLYLGTTNSSYSPEIIAGCVLQVQILDQLNVRIQTKYVGKQYYDNSSNQDLQLPAYLQCNAFINQQIKQFNWGIIDFQMTINNILNADYYANAWVYTDAFTDGSVKNYSSFFQQAPINLMAKIVLRF